MKKLLLLMALSGSVMLPARAHDSLRITPVGGEPVVIHFDHSPEISFTATGLRLTSTATDPVTFDFDEIDSMDFTSISKVESVGADEISLRLTPQALIVENAPEDSNISIFAIDGKQVLVSSFNSSCSVSRTLIPQGIYIIRINNSTFKITL